MRCGLRTISRSVMSRVARSTGLSSFSARSISAIFWSMPAVWASESLTMAWPYFSISPSEPLGIGFLEDFHQPLELRVGVGEAVTDPGELQQVREAPTGVALGELLQAGLQLGLGTLGELGSRLGGAGG